MNSLLQMIGAFGAVLQERLFPALAGEVGAMSPHHEQFVAVLGMPGLEGAVATRRGPGRPAQDRVSIARAFVAKAIFQFPTTRALLDRLRCDAVLRRLCGWETAAAVPDESIFSRTFARFSATRFGHRVH